MKAYTKKAKKVLDIANRVSKSMNYNYVGTEHLLVGLLKEGTGVAAEVLTLNGVELEKLTKLIEDEEFLKGQLQHRHWISIQET